MAEAQGLTQAFRADRVLNIALNSNHSVQTPLRYPGGKSTLTSFFSELIGLADCAHFTFIEPYAGGAGVSLRLLSEQKVSRIVINDYDSAVYSFWHNAVNRPDDFAKMFFSIEPTIEEWHKQKEILATSSSSLSRGVAFLFLNRTNRSGVINGGAIGGLSQEGTYKIDARYNKRTLEKKLNFLRQNASKITVCDMDGGELIRKYSYREDAFFYIDPPYVEKGKSLYLNALTESDHRALSDVLHGMRDSRWVLTYDDAALVKELYPDCFGGRFSLSYSALSRRRAEELMFFSDYLWALMEKRGGWNDEGSAIVE